MKKEVELGESEERERGETVRVDVCACLCGCMCAYVCIHVCVCLGAPRRGTRLEVGFN